MLWQKAGYTRTRIENALFAMQSAIKARSRARNSWPDWNPVFKHLVGVFLRQESAPQTVDEVYLEDHVPGDLPLYAEVEDQVVRRLQRGIDRLVESQPVLKTAKGLTRRA